MSTQIDNISIAITSNSAGAAAGIDALATSLGKLKTNGAVSVAVRNLNNLSDAVKKFSAVSSQAGKLSSLADAVNKLSSAGSFSKVVNQLNKLPTAISGLKNVNLDGVGDKVTGVVNALSGLSSIKSGGFGTMVNSLSKIGDVTKKLDDYTINKFADRVSKLSEKLTPLSQKMATVSAGFRSINTNARSASSGLDGVNPKINTTRLNLASLVTVLQGLVSVLQPVIRLMSFSVKQALEWDGVAARFGRGFGEQADEVYSWIQRLNKEMGINVQQFMQYSSVYATMLTGFGVASKDASKMALGYMELTYDIWAGYNDIYKKMDDAAEAVRSAIAGEVEPIRRAGFTIIESTLEQTAKNHGLEISIEKATEAQKSYLRYLTLVDQAHAQGLVGTYAREMNTAEGVMRTTAQQLKSLAQSFGSLFLPALVKVMPWLQAFVDLLTDAIHAVAAFFGIKIQEINWGNSIGGIGDAADSATGSLDDTAGAVDDVTDSLKDLKNATVGIDELNVISPPTSGAGDSGGAGAGAGAGSGSGFDGLDVDSLWDESIFDGIQNQVDEIKAKIKDWLPVIGLVGTALAGLGIADLLTSLGDALSKMNLMQKGFASLALLTIEAAVVFTLADNYLETGNLLYILGEALVTAAAGYLMFKAWGAGGATLALAVSVAAQLVALETSLADGTIELGDIETWTQAITTTLMGAFGGAIIATKTGFFVKEGFVIGLGTTLSLTMTAMSMGGIESGAINTSDFEFWIMQIVSVAGAGMSGFTVGKALTGTSTGGKVGMTIGITASLAVNFASVVATKGDDFGSDLSDWIYTALFGTELVISGVQLWKWLGPSITTALGGLLPKIGTSLAGAFTGGWSTIVGGLSSIPVWGWIAAAVVALIAGAVTLAIADYDFTDVGEKFGYYLGLAFKYLSPMGLVITLGQWIADAIPSAIEWVKENFSTEMFLKVLLGILFPPYGIDRVIAAMVEVGKNILPGLWEGIVSGWNNMVENVKEFCRGFVQGFKDAFGIHSPSTVFAEIGGYLVEGLWEGIVGLTEWLIGGISGFTTSICDVIRSGFDINVIKDKLSEMWNTATDWWGGAGKVLTAGVSLKKEGWTTVAKWIGSIPGVSQLVSLAKSGWTTVKGWIGSIPGVSQLVSLTKSGWSSVKSWVGSIPKLSQLIGLSKSGWSSVKSWVGSIPKISQSITLAKSGWSTVKKWVGTMPTLSAGIKLAKSGWKSVKDWLGGLTYKLNFTLPKIKVNWSKTTVAGFTISYPSGFSTYAKGGFPDIGQMFIASEAGPELIGRIGNKNAVVNNDQIVDSVSEGVYSAVIAAMRESNGGGGEQAVNVYLDGRQITSTVERRQRERGASIMGNQVYSY